MSRRPVRCGNAARWEDLTDLDRAFILWFRSLLEWSAADPATRGPEPVQPDRDDFPPPSYCYRPRRLTMLSRDQLAELLPLVSCERVATRMRVAPDVHDTMRARAASTAGAAPPWSTGAIVPAGAVAVDQDDALEAGEWRLYDQGGTEMDRGRLVTVEDDTQDRNLHASN